MQSMKTILVVDDEKDIVEAIEYNFKKEGFKVIKAYDGYQAIKEAKEKKMLIGIYEEFL